MSPLSLALFSHTPRKFSGRRPTTHPSSARRHTHANPPMSGSPPPRRTGSVRLEFAPGDVASSVAPLPAALARRLSGKCGVGDGGGERAARSTPAKQAAADARRTVSVRGGIGGGCRQAAVPHWLGLLRNERARPTNVQGARAACLFAAWEDELGAWNVTTCSPTSLDAVSRTRPID